MPVITATAIGALALIAVLLSVIATVLPSYDAPSASCGVSAPTDIPPRYLDLYQQAAALYGVPWTVLAAVGKAESDHGRGIGPGVTTGTNHAGAAGPMQFMPGTWQSFGVDGNADGTKDIYDPADAIPTAAGYLRHSGAPTHLDQALLHYNHDPAYVTKVLRIADSYATACPPLQVSGSERGSTAVAAASRWLGTPYSYGGGGLDGPTTGIGLGAKVTGFDCSGLVRYAWHQAGTALPRTTEEQWRAIPHVPPGRQAPGDLVFFQGSGGGSDRPGHVGLVLDSYRMIEAPRTGARVRISRYTTRRDLVGYARPGG
ncbi:NlpC/P60 family protein [Nonomuraea jiangxiensis]|uniref:Cell wall-associated hydrolase, NlpC family n=1 Tax=Nonomuraea jiangxiensis TaxID=633440 RepID=A0A1G9LPL5_9ACTN|nr:NlpC/P60 family protein [Nonomuraea jiangxiensis]SDL63848.1 Cell wall-associated hydrolase, NlpC family [Nonomuraea jiangxiensis]